MKQDELIFEDDFLFHVISQWKRPQLMLRVSGKMFPGRNPAG